MRFTWLVVVVVGCYSAPDYDGTRFKCDNDHACPDGQMCSGGFCTTMNGSGSGSDGGPRDSSTTDMAPGGTGVICGSTTCGVAQKCCADFISGPSCIALGAGCSSGYQATCDGTEDCAGAPCCDVGGATVQCQASCSTQLICREDADCTNATAPKCCFGTGANEPWGRCWNACA